MDGEAEERRWQELVTEVGREMSEWRAAHPHASFAEIEAAVDARMDCLRARVLQDTVRAHPAAPGGDAAPERPVCPECGKHLVSRGTQRRTLTVRGDQAVHVERRYAVCPACGAGLFPPR
jgi:YgiT-type zinc finger domain-containing protein